MLCFGKIISFSVKRIFNKKSCSSVIFINKLHYDSITIGSVSKPCKPPKNPQLVPIGYVQNNPSQNLLRHLQWLMKKDVLGQDVFLIGFPGPMRRHIALQYIEIVQKEMEYVVLSRDTTETDLKQRREILNGTAYYVDQSAVKAAIEGRVLIIDGVEKVERNVLPVLNNLLENREMQLEDGRFLIAPDRYDKLLLEHSKETLDKWKLVRVSENFRVIALGLPVPFFKGNPLDPPFRSRFQARNIQSTFEEQLSYFSSNFPKIKNETLKNFLSVGFAFHSRESELLALPKFPIENLHSAMTILNSISDMSLECLFRWMYPYNLILPKEGQISVIDMLKSFSIKPDNKKFSFEIIQKDFTHDSHTHTLVFKNKGKRFECEVLGNTAKQSNKTHNSFVPNEYHNNLLIDMLQTHVAHDFCLVGHKGCGKSLLMKKFASILNYSVEMVMMYADMTARDLLQQRITDDSGNTLWRQSQIISAATEGKLLVLDGLHRINSSTLSVLQRLIHDREIQLYDGTRLLRYDRYETMKVKYGFSDEYMKNHNILKIHPSFRIVALAEIPKAQSLKDQWLTPEVMSMFLFHLVRPLSLEEERLILQKLVGKLSDKVETILHFSHKLKQSDDDALKSISGSFSTRQLVRIAQRISAYPDVNVYNIVSQACLMKFLPQLTKQAVESMLDKCGIKNETTSIQKKIIVTDSKLQIGNTVVPVFDSGQDKVKVPDILFYDNQEHLDVMEAMLQDFILGEHLLLVGNQGVGKNKVTDRFLQLLNFPREYIQLHRDTTVQSLTQQPSVVDGKIVYQDSPLLKAVQHGHVLIVDEADKAPTHVTNILKALVESGEMVLFDGRRIIHHSDKRYKNDPNVILMHPNFRMIVLANRPGFPFLGNDFFATLGDIFSCHAVDNPTLESEIAMLRKYAPHVSQNLILVLAKLFGDLRSMSDAGLISYPYSTREIVNIIKHIEKFPDEKISSVLKNVFDFDSFSYDIKETLNSLFNKYGIPIDSETVSVKMAHSFKLPELCMKSKWSLGDKLDAWFPKTADLVTQEEHKWPVKDQKLNIYEARGNVFSEQVCYFKLPIKSNDVPLSIDAGIFENKNRYYIATANPVSLYCIIPDSQQLTCINLSGYFPSIRTGFKPDIKISSLSLPEETMFVNELSTNQFFIIHPQKGIVKKLNIDSIIENTVTKISNVIYKNAAKNSYSHIAFPNRNKILLFKRSSNKFSVLDFSSNKIFQINVPENIKNAAVIDNSTIILVLEVDNIVVNMSKLTEWQTRRLYADDISNLHDITTKTVKDNIDSLHIMNKHQTLLSHPEDFATIILGSFNSDKLLEVYGSPRDHCLPIDISCVLSDSSQVVRFLHSRYLPGDIKKDFIDPNSSHIEVINLKNASRNYIPIKEPQVSTSVASWLANSNENYLLMTLSPSNELITIDMNGFTRKWQIDSKVLEKSFKEWQKIIGLGKQQQLTIEYKKSDAISQPKHGKVDSTGAPHVGGNTWAGGTGGRDTAGLGGKGGPYRLDAGHTVYQLPDSEKNSVPMEIRQAARKMAINAYKAKLKEIEMSEYDAEIYGNFLSNVRKQINTLRVILDGLQAKSKERRWMRHQTSGELDDSKLIEGITGEKSIYKKRGEQEPEMGTPQEKPKLLRLVVDVSGSMYRFNGHDNRLQRELESVVLVMESFDGYSQKFKYEILGHSGEGFGVEFCLFDKPPKNNKDKLDIVKKMYTHSQFCMAGDNTLPATKNAIDTITKEDADEYFVIILSDANFDRYGISPSEFGSILTSNPKVNAFAIFIGSLGNQAHVISKQLPAGRAFICQDSANMTQILQKIFTSALLKD